MHCSNIFTYIFYRVENIFLVLLSIPVFVHPMIVKFCLFVFVTH